MKKFMITVTAVLLCVFGVFGLVACNDNGDSPPPNADSYGKVLVAYFSATGNTESVANYIAAATGGELFEPCPRGCIYKCGSELDER